MKNDLFFNFQTWTRSKTKEFKFCPTSPPLRIVTRTDTHAVQCICNASNPFFDISTFPRKNGFHIFNTQLCWFQFPPVLILLSTVFPHVPLKIIPGWYKKRCNPLTLSLSLSVFQKCVFRLSLWVPNEIMWTMKVFLKQVEYREDQTKAAHRSRPVLMDLIA